MNLKASLRPLVPPIIWTSLSRLKNSVTGNQGRNRSLLSSANGGEFSIEFSKVQQDRGIYFVPKYAEHRPACRAIAEGGVYEPETHEMVSKIMRRKPGSMVHAGTFFGDMLPTFARSCPATIYAFEPVLENFVLAKLAVEANRLENVFLQNAGLSESISIAHIDTGGEGERHRGGSSQLSDSGQVVGLLTIDSLGLNDVTLIQLDVEGHELQALKGASATIQRNKPVIMIEDNSRNCGAFLRDLGYDLAGEIPGLGIWTTPADRLLGQDIAS